MSSICLSDSFLKFLNSDSFSLRRYKTGFKIKWCFRHNTQTLLYRYSKSYGEQFNFLIIILEIPEYLIFDKFAKFIRCFL